MRTTITLTVFLLLAAFAVAQQPRTRVPPNQGAPQVQTEPGQNTNEPLPNQAEPQLPSLAVPAGSTDVVEGCLGGSNPHFTVTDSKGTTYQIVVPQGADSSVLAQHLGEPVKVQGTLDNGGARPGDAPGSIGATGEAGSAAAAGHAIRAQRIGRGTGTCPGSGASTAPPPAKK